MTDELRRDVETDLADLASVGRMRRADELSRATGRHLNATTLPLYFTGDLAAPLVLVHLNPKQGDDHGDRYTGSVPTVEQYVERNSHFGRDTYGPDAPRTHRSPFDRKQLRFLREFDAIEFLPDDHPDADYLNLERSVDRKLQLELVPYGSDNFAMSATHARALQPHLERLLAVITRSPRRYVIFCGAVFIPLLRRFVTNDHRFHLIKNNGSSTKATARFLNLEIADGEHGIRAGLAATFAQQGIPMQAYARECAARY